MDHLAKALGVTSKDILYIGDSVWDYYCARDSGAGFIGIAHGENGHRKWERVKEEVELIENISELIGRFATVSHISLQRYHPCMRIDPRYKAVCFDMDGTLLDTKVDYQKMSDLIFDEMIAIGVPEDVIDRREGYKGRFRRGHHRGHDPRHR